MPATTTKTAAPERRLAYSVDEAGELIGLGRTRLYEEAAAGRLTIRKSGRRSIITVDDLQRYLDSLPAFEATAA